MKAFRQWGRRLRSRLSEHALILGYHRIALASGDPYKLCVSPQHFTEHLQVLLNCNRPISLANLVDNLKSGQAPERAVVLTFDDGYDDILQMAMPRLEQHDVPATVFVVTGCLGQTFWWDRLEYALRAKGEHKSSNGSQSENILSMYHDLLRADPEEREKAIAEVETTSGFRKSTEEELPRTMTADEVRRLAACDLLEIGSHSHTHPWLSSLSTEEQLTEVSQSKLILEDILGQEVGSFSYPNGSYSKDTALIVESLGFHCACTSVVDVARNDSGLYQLPRLWVPDINGEEFERWLSKW